MKRLMGFFGVALVLIGVARASDCRLERSIPFRGSLLENKYFTDIETSEPPKFLNRDSYDPDSDTLAMLIFEINNNGSQSGLGGAKLGIERKRDVVGFSNFYTGSTVLDGGKEETEGRTTYWTRWVATYPDAPGEAVTELRVGVENRRIVSIEFTHPVFDVIGTDGPYTYVQFTGENQVLCVTRARLTNKVWIDTK